MPKRSATSKKDLSLPKVDKKIAKLTLKDTELRVPGEPMVRYIHNSGSAEFMRVLTWYNDFFWENESLCWKWMKKQRGVDQYNLLRMRSDHLTTVPFAIERLKMLGVELSEDILERQEARIKRNLEAAMAMPQPVVENSEGGAGNPQIVQEDALRDPTNKPTVKFGKFKLMAWAEIFPKLRAKEVKTMVTYIPKYSTLTLYTNDEGIDLDLNNWKFKEATSKLVKAEDLGKEFILEECKKIMSDEKVKNAPRIPVRLTNETVIFYVG